MGDFPLYQAQTEPLDCRTPLPNYEEEEEEDQEENEEETVENGDDSNNGLVNGDVEGDVELLDTGERQLQEIILKAKEEAKKNVNILKEEDMKMETGHHKIKEEVDHDTDRQYSDNPNKMSTVECGICGSTVPHHAFRNHISTQHTVNFRNYKEAYGQPEFKRKLFHKCKECQADILHSLESICSHLKQEHDLNLEQYKDKHSVFKEPMDVEDTFDYNAWLRDFNEFGEDGEKYFSDALDEGCIYKCLVCKEDVIHFMFQDHLSSEHGMELSSYLEEWKEHEYTRISFYKCRICEAEVMLASPDIIKHVRDTHSISMEEYILRHGGFEAGFMTQNITSLISREDILSVEGGVLDQNLQEIREYTDNLEYSCLYRCRACKKVVSNLTFDRHISRKHDLDRTKYNQEYGALEYTRLVYYRCKICQTPVIFSFQSIESHVKEYHSLTIEDYELDFNAFESSDKKGATEKSHATCYVPLDDEEPTFSDSLDDMSLFKCNECDLVLYFELLHKHKQVAHNIKREYDHEEELLKVERLTYYRCKLCPTELIFTIKGISDHVNFTHSLTLKEYASSYQAFHSGDRKYNSNVTKLKELRKRSAPLLGIIDDKTLRKKIRRAETGERIVSDNPDDMCICKCGFCGKNILHHLLRKHVIKQHPEYKDFIGDYDYVLKTYYRCKVCDAEILFSLESIKNHVKKSHRMTLTVYKDRYQAFTEDPAYADDDLQEDIQEIDESVLDPDYREKQELERELKALTKFR